VARRVRHASATRPAPARPPVRRRILDALDRLVRDPPAGDVVKLTGREEWRLSVGDWHVRMRFDDAQSTVIVLRVLPRGRAYSD
jgi:mRNA-degrading endonuclease RelE of RelBE toxin-antitoxin system